MKRSLSWQIRAGLWRAVGGLCLMAVSMGCWAKKAPTSYLRTLDYQGRATLGESLFKEDQSLISNEEIDRILSSKIELPREGRLAVLQLGGDPHVLVLPQVGSDADMTAVADLLADLETSERLSSVALLPSLLVPRNLSVAKLREAAARFQADLLFIYRTPCRQFRNNRFLAAGEAKAYCVAEGLLLDVRTGIIPFSAVGSATFEAREGPEDLNSYETLRRSESEAVRRALGQLADELLEFLSTAP